MYRDDMTNDNGRWLPEEGWRKLEVVSIKEKTSKQGNPMFCVNFADDQDSTKGLEQLLTNIPGKRWMLRQLLEACGIVPETNPEGKKIYTWDIPDVERKKVDALIEHDKTPFIGRDGVEVTIPKAKIIEFR